MDNWKEYNRMIVHMGEPHEQISLKKEDIKRMWKAFPHALLIRYTDNWDKKDSDGWYYIIRDYDIVLEDLRKSARSQVRKGERNFEIRKFNFIEKFDEVYEVYLKACERYENYEIRSKENYFEFVKNQYHGRVDFWGGFDKENGCLMGYSICTVYDTCVDWNEATFNPDALKLRISDYMEYYLIRYYINIHGYNYLISGQKNINHKTNVQEYDIKQFGFRKAYCDLHVIFNPRINIIVSLIRPLKKIILRLSDKHSFFNKINSLVLLADYRE